MWQNEIASGKYNKFENVLRCAAILRKYRSTIKNATIKNFDSNNKKSNAKMDLSTAYRYNQNMMEYYTCKMTRDAEYVCVCVFVFLTF